MQGSVVALVPAAGRGERLGGATPKALVELAGEALLVHAVRALTASRTVERVVVAAPEDRLEEVRALVPDAIVVAGGASRVESVAAALAAAGEAEVVLVHDAARPLASAELIDRVAAAVLDGAGAVVPVVPVADTVKRVDAAGRVLETVDRADLRAVQTPQGFRLSVLLEAHARAAEEGEDATDDAGLVERLGGEVVTVPGEERAFKITTPADLGRAEALLAAVPS